MKAKLETLELQNRGVVLESETEEEANILFRLWTGKGRAVSFTRLLSGAGFDIKTGIRLSIAPSAAESDKDNKNAVREALRILNSRKQ